MIITKKQRRLRRAPQGPRAHPRPGVARLTVHRTPRHIYAQVTDPVGAKVLAVASTLQEAVRQGLKSTGNVEAAKAVGRAIATRAKAGGVKARSRSTAPASSSTACEGARGCGPRSGSRVLGR